MPWGLYIGNRCHLQSGALDPELSGGESNATGTAFSAAKLSLGILLAIACGGAAADTKGGGEKLLAFPGAQGAAAHTPGGRGGKIVRVTTLAPTGAGSLLEALDTEGPRIVVFEVGGVIDFARHEIKITKPFLTVAGQTAPSPGITLIRTGIDVTTHDVVLQHIRVRTGSAGAAHARAGNRMHSQGKALTTSSSITAR